MAEYKPCPDGIHVCGLDGPGERFTTEDNFPGLGRCHFEWARTELQATADEPCDLVVDLFEGRSLIDDFTMTRQMLPRLLRLLRPGDGGAGAAH